MGKFLRNLFISPGLNDDRIQNLGIQNQVKYMKKIWNDNTYGIERLLRIFLFLIQFLFPVLRNKEVSVL